MKKENVTMADKTEGAEPKRYGMKVLYNILGGHTHCMVWIGPLGGTYGKAGNITMTNEEFEAWHLDRMSIQWEERLPMEKMIPVCTNCRKKNALVLIDNGRIKCIRDAGGCGAVFALSMDVLKELYRPENE